MSSDLAPSDLSALDWAPAQRRQSLDAVFAHAVALVDDAESWYTSNRRSKRRGAQWLRVTAIVLGAAAAALPVVSQITTEGQEVWIDPGWSAVILIGAAAAITLDRFFGFSSAWMRYMATTLALARLRREFEYGWNLMLVGIDDPPTDAQVIELLKLAHALVRDVDAAVAEETAQWVIDFRGGLEHTERNLPPQVPQAAVPAAAPAPGALPAAAPPPAAPATTPPAAPGGTPTP